MPKFRMPFFGSERPSSDRIFGEISEGLPFESDMSTRRRHREVATAPVDEEKLVQLRCKAFQKLVCWVFSTAAGPSIRATSQFSSSLWAHPTVMFVVKQDASGYIQPLARTGSSTLKCQTFGNPGMPFPKITRLAIPFPKQQVLSFF